MIAGIPLVTLLGMAGDGFALMQKIYGAIRQHPQTDAQLAAQLDELSKRLEADRALVAGVQIRDV